MTLDHYAGAGPRWASGATLVYGPLARVLVAASPHPLAGRVVLDAGAGTGVVSSALDAVGARVVAVDFSHGMLAWEQALRPPCAVGDLRALPLAADAVDDCVAAFVLNHLTHPAVGMRELVRVTRPGGAILVTVFANESRSAARDRVDEVVAGEGWIAPPWYVELKTAAAPVLGSATNMAAAATIAGLADVAVREDDVDVGVTDAEALVAYRFGQAQFAAWLDEIGPDRAGEVARRAVAAVGPAMAPYRPTVVLLSSRVPSA